MIELKNISPKRKLIYGLAAGFSVILIVTLIRYFSGYSRPYTRHLYIDTVSQSISSRVAELQLDEPYYTRKVRTKTKTFYQQSGYKTKWLEMKKPNRSYKAFIKVIRESERYGFDPAHYQIETLTKEVDSVYANRKRTREQVEALDLRLTAAFFLFTTHLTEGRIRTAGYGDKIWKKDPPAENDVQLLLENSSGELRQIIEKLHPPHRQYALLQKALEQYRELEQTVSLKPLKAPGKFMLKPGQRHELVPEIRKRITLTDLKAYPVNDSLLYDDKLVEGVKQFQERHSLQPDGIIGASTMRYLSQSFKEKADLIELNLERLRWLPHTYGQDHISINIPEYMLRVYRDEDVEMEMRVVIGSAYTATPIFRDSLEYIEFSPTWTIPPGIMKDEVLPRLQKNPEYYDTTLITIYRNGNVINPVEEDWSAYDSTHLKEFKVVQKPGKANPLGAVKFMMPNELFIYLHDTPAGHLFNAEERTFSHGCIRVEQPVELAKYLLRDQKDWDEKAIMEAMQSEKPVRVNLKKKYHVEIEYRTVWADKDGLIHFRDDVYGYDKVQLARLSAWNKKDNRG